VFSLDEVHRSSPRDVALGHTDHQPHVGFGHFVLASYHGDHPGQRQFFLHSVGNFTISVGINAPSHQQCHQLDLIAELDFFSSSATQHPCSVPSGPARSLHGSIASSCIAHRAHRCSGVSGMVFKISRWSSSIFLGLGNQLCFTSFHRWGHLHKFSAPCCFLSNTLRLGLPSSSHRVSAAR